MRTSDKKPKGGVRPGAGRPKTLLEPTVPVRVPPNWAKWIKENRDWLDKNPPEFLKRHESETEHNDEMIRMLGLMYS